MLMTGSAIELMEQQLKERIKEEQVGGEGSKSLSPRWLATVQLLALHRQPKRLESTLFTSPCPDAPPIPVRQLPLRKSMTACQPAQVALETGAWMPHSLQAPERALASSVDGSPAYTPSLGIEFYILRSGVVRVKAITPGTAADLDGR